MIPSGCVDSATVVVVERAKIGWSQRIGNRARVSLIENHNMALVGTVRSSISAGK
jgi:hypothetical protein